MYRLECFTVVARERKVVFEVLLYLLGEIMSMKYKTGYGPIHQFSHALLGFGLRLDIDSECSKVLGK